MLRNDENLPPHWESNPSYSASNSEHHSQFKPTISIAIGAPKYSWLEKEVSGQSFADPPPVKPLISMQNSIDNPFKLQCIQNPTQESTEGFQLRQP